jgi:cation diffusion facilitator CzcD-associated flavoprotein CzcO
VYEEAWQRGGMAITNTYTDLLTDEEANRTISEFLRAKIRDVVDDPEVARKLTPEFPFGTKRVILDTGYFETYNRSNVELVDLREEPIQKMTADGVETKSGRYDLDALVLATGYDALTGALTRLNPIGRGGVSLRERWSHQISTYLGLHVAGFPNFFIIHGPLTPSVMFNMPLGAELQSDWIADLIQFMRTQGLATAEATPQAEAEWKALIDELADATLFRRTPSWYTGGNVPGKPYQFLVHLGGPKYYEALATVTQPEYDGLELAPEPATVSNDVDAYS